MKRKDTCRRSSFGLDIAVERKGKNAALNFILIFDAVVVAARRVGTADCRWSIKVAPCAFWNIVGKEAASTECGYTGDLGVLRLRVIGRGFGGRR